MNYRYHSVSSQELVSIVEVTNIRTCSGKMDKIRNVQEDGIKSNATG